MEQEKRGVYAGAVGRFDFNSNELDTCIAIRTMTFKDGVAYLQSGELYMPQGDVRARLMVISVVRWRNCLRQHRGRRIRRDHQQTRRQRSMY